MWYIMSNIIISLKKKLNIKKTSYYIEKIISDYWRRCLPITVYFQIERDECDQVGSSVI